MTTTKESFYIKENLFSSKEITSPSKRFKLIIESYKTKEGCWSYARGIIYRLSDNSIIYSIDRNYSTFHHSWIIKDGQEYLISGESYLTQIIIDLETSEVFKSSDNKNSNAFCWADVLISSDGKTLVVDGCVWGGPYEIRFYDFTDPSKGWPELPLKNKDDSDFDNAIYSSHKSPTFSNDEIMCHNTSRFYIPLQKTENDIDAENIDIDGIDYDNDDNWELINDRITTLKRANDSIIIDNIWISDDEKLRIKKNKEDELKWETWCKNFTDNDPIYLKIKELSNKINPKPKHIYETIGQTYKNWCESFSKVEKRWIFAINIDSNIRFDIEWGVETGPIKLIHTHNGKTNNYFFCEHSVKSVIEAFDKLDQLNAS